jgi:hypothetical protein
MPDARAFDGAPGHRTLIGIMRVIRVKLIIMLVPGRGGSGVT